jgi:hypothetical protein
MTPRIALALLLLLAACNDDPGASNLTPGQDMAPDQAAQPDQPADTPDQPAAPDLTAGPDLTESPDLGDDMDAPDLPAASRCERSERVLSCPFMTITLTPDELYGPRKVHWQVPLGAAPEGGWPAVILFQGSLLGAVGGWDGTPGELYGAEYQTRLIAALLDSGYAVLTPETRLDGATYWDTNVAPWSFAWESAPDHDLMLALFAAIDEGRFGEVSGQDLRAVGISSGGYMASRVGITYKDRIRAIAVQSASYATCGGSFCVVPSLEGDHPPTLLLHGSFDVIVPEWTMRLYESALDAASIPHRVVVDPLADHAWLSVAPDEVVGWFTQH